MSLSENGVPIPDAPRPARYAGALRMHSNESGTRPDLCAVAANIESQGDTRPASASPFYI
ncbi:hypothetical protein CAL19_00275 [Bordetella genomosp. 7]|uniref:Uncharacterized protein n=1 Tax=Bordetella genomosp. 7 TaxID=1416805 RepID=A0A261RSG1_9BORD|nr:hypothetical protein CAL19_00275 [Bordetella genomosp. 7]